MIKRKRVMWRSRNLGMKELDLLVGEWTRQNVNNMGEHELNRF